MGTYINDQEHAIIEGLNVSSKLVLHGQRNDYFLITDMQYAQETTDYELVVNKYKRFGSFPNSIGIVYDGNNNRTLDQDDDLIALALNTPINTVEASLTFIV